MKKIIIIVLLLASTFIIATCERSDMYNLATIGLPPKGVIYIFNIGMSSGDLGSRNDANTTCYNMGIMYHSIIKASTVKAFRSYSGIDEIRFLVPTQYWLYPVFGISSTMKLTMISTSWAGLWDGALESNIDTAVGLVSPSPWWSGSNDDGSASVNNCGSWQDSNSATMGQVGSTLFSDSTVTCDTSQYVLCLAY